MTSYIVAAAICPPEGKEWLIAERRQLESAHGTIGDWLDELWEKMTFPDKDTSLEEKDAFIQRLRDEYSRGNSQRKAFCSFADLAAEALFCVAPREMSVEVSICHGDSGPAAVIGAVSCSNEDILHDIVLGLLEKKGVKTDEITLQLIGSSHELQREVGRNVYAPVNHKNDQKMSRCCVRVLVQLPSPQKMTNFVQLLESARSASLGKGYILIPKKSSSDEESDSGGGDGGNPHVLWFSSLDFSIQSNRVLSHFVLGEGETHRVRQMLKYHTADAAILRAQMFESELQYIKYDMSKQGGWDKKLCAAIALTKVGMEHTQWLQDHPPARFPSALIRDLATYWRTILLQRGDEELGIDFPTGAPGASLAPSLGENCSSGNPNQSTTSPVEKEATAKPTTAGAFVSENPHGRKIRNKGGRPKGSGTKRGKPAPRLGEPMSLSREALCHFLEDAATTYEDIDSRIKFNWRLGHSRNPKGRNAMNKKQRKEG